MDEVDVNLRGLAEQGFIRFSIRDKDTPQNQAIHDGFREFARVECRDNYTVALEKLLEYYQADAKFEMLWDKVQEFEARIAALQERMDVAQAAAMKVEKKDDDGGMF